MLTQLELEKVPRRPVLSTDGFARRGGDVPSVHGAAHVVALDSGRVALAAALERIGCRPGDEVLVPAYHCTAMIAPIAALELRPVFYAIDADCGVSVDELRSRTTPRTRAAVVVHYFGVPQRRIAELARFCGEAGIALIEDCAHSFYGGVDGRPLGSFGDYAIASAKKFMPVYDGGLLVSFRHALDSVRIRRRGWLFELKSLANILDRSARYDRMVALHRVLAPLGAVRTFVWNAVKKRGGASLDAVASTSPADGTLGFDRAWLDISMSRVSQLAMRYTDHARACERRRRNYLELHEALGNVRGCRPLFDELPLDAVPYVFPLYVDDIDAAFDTLKKSGVPIERFGEELWPGATEASCDHAHRYSRHVIQLPCHQGLRDEELAWIASTVRDVVGAR